MCITTVWTHFRQHQPMLHTFKAAMSHHNKKRLNVMILFFYYIVGAGVFEGKYHTIIRVYRIE